MAEPEASPVNPFSSIFWQNNPNVNRELRQRIALAMMQKRSQAPKNVGEGLNALGEGLADRMIAKQLEQSDLAEQAGGKSELQRLLGSGTQTSEAQPPADRVAYAPATDTAAAAPTSSTPPTQTTKPDLLQSTEQPADMLGSSLPRGLAGPAVSNIPTPAQSASLMDPNPTRTRVAAAIDAQRPKPQGFDVAPGAIRDQGDYNEIDASAGMKKVTPGYMQDAIARQTDDPDMRAYLGSLSASEAKNAQDVSSTGASGPFQFTRGTGKQYGLFPGGDDQRANLDASASAALDLTQDNANAFRRINGREPTMADLALMHQQGGTTGSRMIAGTGNAPAANLAVNNVAPGAGPAAATARIKGYYGLPERTIADTGRTTLQGPGPAPGGAPRTMAFGGEPTPAGAPAAALMPPGGGQIAPAPAQAPPVRVAQAGPQGPGQLPPDGLVIPAPGEMPRRQILQPDARERELFIAANTTQNQYSKPAIAALYAEKVKDRERRQAELDKVFEHQLSMRTEQQKEHWKSSLDAPKRAADVAKTRSDTDKDLLQEVNGQSLIRTGAGTYRAPIIEGQDTNAKPTTRLNEFQSKEIKYLNEMYTAGRQLAGKEKILADGMKDELAGKVPFGGNALMNKHYRMAKNAAETWVAAQLRDISGAVVGTEEHAKRMKMLMPRYGDTDADIKNKQAVRKSILAGMEQGVPDEHVKYAQKRVADVFAGLDKDLQDKMKGKTPGPNGILTNKKTGEKVIWDANEKKWREYF